MFEDVFILDLETTIRASAPHFGATPAWPDNRTVSVGYIHRFEYSRRPPPSRDRCVITTQVEDLVTLFVANQHALWVGHNIGFDMHYLMKELELERRVSIPPRVWDTMKFQHIWEGRGDPNPSLEKCAKIWGILFKKDEEIKERFKAGIGADEIDEALLHPYLEADVQTTAELFDRQYAEVTANQSDREFRYFLEMMQGVMTTTQMAYTGIHFNKTSAEAELVVLAEKQKGQEKKLESDWAALWPDNAATDWNPNSPAQVEALMWGSTEIKARTLESVRDEEGELVRYKTGARKGEVKTKVKEFLESVEALVHPKVVEKFEAKGWDMKAGAQTLENIAKYDTGIAKEFAEDILALRNTVKTASTYFKPYIEYQINGVIHPNFNHCVAATGRLSSSKPNMQNINSKDNRQ